MHHEGKRPRSALRVSGRAGRIAFGAVGAERRRPRQHQQVIIELAGLALAAILRGRRAVRTTQATENCRTGGKSHKRERHDFLAVKPGWAISQALAYAATGPRTPPLPLVGR